MNASPAAAATDSARRSPLSRQRILETALELVDRDGLDELSMRKLAAELGVEAMSLYRHVASKDDLLAGLADLVWAEIAAAAPPDDDWAAWLRAFGQGVRDVVHRHPNALPVLVAGEIGPPAGLELFADQLERRDLGTADQRAVSAIRTVGAFALGTAITELSCFGSAPARRDETERQQLVRISRSLPSDTPQRLVEAALTVCDCDAGKVFTEGLELIVRGCDLDPEA